tara:strand:+ start:12383 stop:12787 length:405 start_codon:yes stop_codon:yes gene_type:complete
MDSMKLPIALVAAMAVQLAGAVWWVSQQAATISNLQDTVSVLNAENKASDKVNMQRDILANSEKIEDIIDYIVELEEEGEETASEVWDDIELIWEDLDGMTSSLMEIVKVQGRIKTLENTLEYLTRTPAHSDAR